MVVYIYHCSSPNLSHPPLLPLCPHFHSLYLCLYSCPANRIICTIFSRFYESESEVTPLCPTLCDPVDCSLPGSSICGVLQAKILEWVAISFSRGSSRPRDRTQVSLIAGRRFTLWATRALIYNIRFSLSDLLHSVTDSTSTHINCCCSVTKSYLTLCNPMNCSMPGFPVLHYFPKFAQTHVH